MKIPLFTSVALFIGLLATTASAATLARFEALGDNTFAATREAGNTFSRDLDALKAEALNDASAYCAKMHKQMKVISTTAHKPMLMLTGFASAKVVFKALDAGDPELSAPVQTTSSAATATAVTAAAHDATDALYNDLMKLDDLRKRGILTDEEFQAEKKKLLEKAR